MPTEDIETLREELDQFRKEKDKIRRLVGDIGGASKRKRDQMITLGSVAAIAVLFMLDILRHILGLKIPLPPLFSIEVGVLLVSIKIIWMIHNQSRIEHFQFWILNSIEFRLNDISKQIREMRGKG